MFSCFPGGSIQKLGEHDGNEKAASNRASGGLAYSRSLGHASCDCASPVRDSNRASSHAKTGRAVRLVPSLAGSLPANREIVFAWKSTRLAAGGPGPSFQGNGPRNRLFEPSLRAHGADALRGRGSKAFSVLLIVTDRALPANRQRSSPAFVSSRPASSTPLYCEMPGTSFAGPAQPVLWCQRTARVAEKNPSGKSRIKQRDRKIARRRAVC